MGSTEAILLIVVMPISIYLFTIAIMYLLFSRPLKNKSPEEAIKVLQKRASRQYREMMGFSIELLSPGIRPTFGVQVLSPDKLLTTYGCRGMYTPRRFLRLIFVARLEDR